MCRSAGAVKFRGGRLCPIEQAHFYRAATGGDRKQEEAPMSAFTDYKKELEHHEQMYGKERGRLAVGLDRLTNALVLVGQHGVYCTSQRNPALPAMDIRLIAREITHAKELVQSVMEELRKASQKKADSPLR
jgi:hypothetical protein